MDACLRESLAEAKAREFEDRVYRKIYLTNLIERAEKVVNETQIQFREMASNRNITDISRHRMSKELAIELTAEMGDRAYFFCTEKLANNTQSPRLWRDVLTCLDEIKGKPNET